MSHRTTGLTFIAIAAFLYATRYLAAAIYMSGHEASDRYRGISLRGIFNEGLDSLGPQLGVLALVSFVIGCWLLPPLKESQTLKGQRREQEEG